jgi:hypothetical protein
VASGDVFESVRVRDFIPQNGFTQDPHKLRAVAFTAGYPLRKADNDGFYLVFKVWNNGSPLTTGITVEITTVDDPNNSAPGAVYRLGVSGAKLVSGTTNLGSLVMGTETLVNVTGASTNGVFTTTALAITTANLNTPAAGNLVALYIRRNGGNAADTHTGEILVTNVVIKDT